MVEQNKYTAQRRKSIYGLAALSGYMPSFGKAANAAIKLYFMPHNEGTYNVILNNEEPLTCTQNGLLYNIVLPQEGLILSVDKDKIISVAELGSSENLKVGDYVIVETSLGQGYAVVDKIEELSNTDNLEELKSVVRKATKEDKKQHEVNCEKEKTAINVTKELVEKMNLDMNVVNAEYSFDGTKVIIDFKYWWVK